MSSLLDNSSDSDNSSYGMNSESDADDDGTTFTVANVLQKRGGPSDRSRRDTITRIMPTISIRDSHDKYAMPDTVQRKQMHHNLDSAPFQLRVTDSFMDELSQSRGESRDEFRRESNISGMTSRASFGGSVFRTPLRDRIMGDDIANESTIIRRHGASLDASKQTNLLDEEALDDDEIEFGNIPDDSKQSNRRRHSSETFMAVYEELAAKKIARSSAQTNDRDSVHASPKSVNVKTLVTTALKIVTDGLVAHATSTTCDGIGTWDVDETRNMSGKKRSLGADDAGNNNDGKRHNRRKSLNIRAELTLMQDLLEERTEECAKLKRKLEEHQSQNQILSGGKTSLQLENRELMLLATERENIIHSLKAEKEQALAKASSLEVNICELQAKADGLMAELDASKADFSIVAQAKVILESKLALSRKVASAANANVKSISSQLENSRSQSEQLALDLQIKHEELEKSISELNRMRKEKDLDEKERESSLRVELQGKMDEMREALRQIRDVERVRMERTKLIETELQGTRNDLLNANSKVAESEAAVTSLRCTVDELQRENQSLRDLTEMMRETPNRWKMELTEGTDGIEVEMNRRTPGTMPLDNINSLGAEDTANSDLSDHVSKLPLMAILQRTPDSSSRQLSFAPTEGISTPGKENHHPQMKSDCALCYRPHMLNAAIKTCQCGRDDCIKWAHSTCILTRKSVSKSVSHPGTPAPVLPMVLCEGIWRNNDKLREKMDS